MLRFLAARLQRCIRQKLISAERNGYDEMAAMLGADIEALRGYGEVVPGVDFPIVYGGFDAGALRRVLIDSMYNLTAADEPGWVVPRASTAGRLPTPSAVSLFVGMTNPDDSGAVFR